MKTGGVVKNRKDIKWMPLGEFVESGYLQEINRQLLHPLGLALAVTQEKSDGRITGFAGVLDYRDDPEGMCYSDEELAKPDTERKAQKIAREMLDRGEKRRQRLGYVFQPVSGLDYLYLGVLVGAVLRNVGQLVRDSGKVGPLWWYVSVLFGLEASEAKYLCEWNGFDPWKVTGDAKPALESAALIEAALDKGADENERAEDGQ